MDLNQVWAGLGDLTNTLTNSYVKVKQINAATKATPSGRLPDPNNRNAVPGDYSTYPYNDAQPKPDRSAPFGLTGYNMAAIGFGVMLVVLLIIRFKR